MRVGQIRATAVKIAKDIDAINQSAVETYKNSFKYIQDLENFVTSSELCKTIKDCFDFLHISPPCVENISVNNPYNSSYRRYCTIKRDTDLSSIFSEIFEHTLEYKFEYKSASAEDVYNKLEYQTITSQNLLEIEQQVKDSYKNASGFSVRSNASNTV